MCIEAAAASYKVGDTGPETKRTSPAAGKGRLPRPAIPVVLATVAEGVPQDLAGCQAGHHDHRPQGDVLKDHRQAVVAAIPGHHLGLGAKVAQIVGRRHRHKPILSQLEIAAQ